jgi:ABC-2 type transport system ATP-binding protein
VVFGDSLHISGTDPDALRRQLQPLQNTEHRWLESEAELEDVFINLMQDRAPS